MKLQAFAESIAIKVNKEEDLGAIEAFKFDILGYRASIISRFDSATLPSLYYQYLNNFKIEKSTTILGENFELIKIPKLISFKNNEYAIKAFNKIGNKISFIDVIDDEQAQYVKTGTRFTQNHPRLVYSNNSVWAVNFNLSSLNGLTLAAIFNNPLEAISYTQNSCSMESKCIVEGDLEIEDSLYQQIVIFMYKQLGVQQDNIITPNEK
jgi:hypothetical protein